MNEYAIDPNDLKIRQENSKLFSELLPNMAADFLEKVTATKVIHPFFIISEDEIMIYDNSGYEKKLYVKMVFSGKGFDTFNETVGWEFSPLTPHTP